MLAYIVVAEVGYMVGGAWLGNQLAMTGAILHIINDAVMTFLRVPGRRVHLPENAGATAFEDLQGLFKKMPWDHDRPGRRGPGHESGCRPFAAFSPSGTSSGGGLEAGALGLCRGAAFLQPGQCGAVLPNL